MANLSQNSDQYSNPKKERADFFIYVLVISVLFFLFSLIFGHIVISFELILGVLFFCALLFFCYLNLSATFLAIIFLLPILIGQDRYQIDIAPFLPSFLGIKNLAMNPFSLTCVFICFLSAVEIAKKKLVFFHTPLFFIISIVIILSFISLGLSRYGSLGLVFELYLLTAFMAYFSGYYLLGNKEKYLNTIIVMLLSSLVPAIAAVYQIITNNYHFEGDSGLARLSATFPHSNTFGSFLFVILTLSLAIFFALRSKRSNGDGNLWKNDVWRYVPFLILFPFLILTFSRTAWIGFLLSSMLFAYLIPAFRFPLVYGVSLSLFLGMFIAKIRERLTGIFERHMFDSLYGRMEIWDMALFEARKKPLVGFGIGSFGDIIKEVQGKETGNVYPHNDVLRFFLEGGFLLLSGYILYMLGALYYSLKSYLRYPKIKEEIKLLGKKLEVDFKLLGIVPFALFGVMAATSLVEAPSMDFVFQIFSWTLLGSWLGTSQRYLNNN